MSATPENIYTSYTCYIPLSVAGGSRIYTADPNIYTPTRGSTPSSGTRGRIDPAARSPAYRAAQGMSARPTPKPPFWTSSSTPKRLVGTWPDLVGRAGAALPEGSVVAGYDRSVPYQLGALLDHATYGVGVVVEAPSRGKVLVRFADGDKLLVAGG